MKQKESVGAFLVVMQNLEAIMNLDYQRDIWVNHIDPNIVDSFDDTITYFCESAEILLRSKSKNRTKMTESQYLLLKDLYNKVDEYVLNSHRPEEVKEIVVDPEWIKITKCAMKVYEELKKASIFRDFLMILTQDIKPFSDLEYQIRVWYKGLGPEVSSYGEAYMNLIGDLEVFFENTDSYPLDKKQILDIDTLRQKIQNYDEALTTSDPIEDELKLMLEDPNWIEITKFAKKVYEELKGK